jgi:hypothetical protein
MDGASICMHPSNLGLQRAAWAGNERFGSWRSGSLLKINQSIVQLFSSKRQFTRNVIWLDNCLNFSANLRCGWVWRCVFEVKVYR